MIRKSAFAIACATTVLGLAAAPAQAITFNLGELINPSVVSQGEEAGTFTWGGKKFSDFSCNIETEGRYTRPGGCENIQIITLDGDPSGIRFQSGFLASRGSELLVDIDYTVELLDPDSFFDGADLSFNGAFVGAGAQTQVTQTIKDSEDNVLAEMNVNNPTQDSSTPTLQDSGLEGNDQPTSQVANELRKIKVENQIEILSGNRSRGFISFIDQRFEARRTEVPEPGTIGSLLLFGSFGLGSIWRKNRQNQVGENNNDN